MRKLVDEGPLIKLVKRMWRSKKPTRPFMTVINPDLVSRCGAEQGEWTCVLRAGHKGHHVFP